MGVAPYTEPERRTSPRKEENLKIEYALQDELETEKIDKIRATHSANVGGGGLCVYVNEDIDFNVGTQLYMILNLPDQKKIFFIAQVVYINPIEEGDYRYKVGLRYLDMIEEDRVTIMNFLSQTVDATEMIRKKAYELYEKRGYVHGNDWLDWFKAERLIIRHSDK